MSLLSTAEADQLNVNKTESGLKSTLIASVNAKIWRAIADTTRPEMLHRDLLHRDNSAEKKSSRKSHKLINLRNRNPERNTEWDENRWKAVY